MPPVAATYGHDEGVVDVRFLVMTSDTTTVLRQWHEGVNAGDMEAVATIRSEDVAVTGPCGVGRGRDLVRARLVRSGIRLEPHEDFVERDGRVVVRETARWTTATTSDGAPLESVTTWCVFTVNQGLVSSIARFDKEAEIPPPSETGTPNRSSPYPAETLMR